eukprot:GHVS01069556.1.p1 GENE.GHVS01069556.1~~GHVS01069556.1.p1  ORF type:complete len:666 (+),score=45.84 GHVS01069556.1:69-2066(+)
MHLVVDGALLRRFLCIALLPLLGVVSYITLLILPLIFYTNTNVLPAWPEAQLTKESHPHLEITAASYSERKHSAVEPYGLAMGTDPVEPSLITSGQHTQAIRLDRMLGPSKGEKKASRHIFPKNNQLHQTPSQPYSQRAAEAIRSWTGFQYSVSADGSGAKLLQQLPSEHIQGCPPQHLHHQSSHQFAYPWMQHPQPPVQHPQNFGRVDLASTYGSSQAHGADHASAENASDRKHQSDPGVVVTGEFRRARQYYVGLQTRRELWRTTNSADLSDCFTKQTWPFHPHGDGTAAIFGSDETSCGLSVYAQGPMHDSKVVVVLRMDATKLKSPNDMFIRYDSNKIVHLHYWELDDLFHAFVKSLAEHQRVDLWLKSETIPMFKMQQTETSFAQKVETTLRIPFDVYLGSAEALDVKKFDGVAVKLTENDVPSFLSGSRNSYRVLKPLRVRMNHHNGVSRGSHNKDCSLWTIPEVMTGEEHHTLDVQVAQKSFADSIYWETVLNGEIGRIDFYLSAGMHFKKETLKSVEKSVQFRNGVLKVLLGDDEMVVNGCSHMIVSVDTRSLCYSVVQSKHSFLLLQFFSGDNTLVTMVVKIKYTKTQIDDIIHKLIEPHIVSLLIPFELKTLLKKRTKGELWCDSYTANILWPVSDTHLLDTLLEDEVLVEIALF